MNDSIHYTVSLADFEAFIEHELRTTYSRKLLIQGASNGAFLGGAAYLFLYSQYRSHVAAAAVGLVLFLVMFYAIPGVTRDQQRKAFRQLFRGQTDSAFGEHTMSLLSDGISIVGPNSKSKVTWAAIQRVSTTTQHAFIHLGPAKALVVPLAGLSNSQAEHFLAEIRSKSTGGATAA